MNKMQKKNNKVAQSLVRGGTTHSLKTLLDVVIPDAIQDCLMDKIFKRLPSMLRKWEFNTLEVGQVTMSGKKAVIVLYTPGGEMIQYKITISRVKSECYFR